MMATMAGSPLFVSLCLLLCLHPFFVMGKENLLKNPSFEMMFNKREFENWEVAGVNRYKPSSEALSGRQSILLNASTSGVVDRGAIQTVDVSNIEGDSFHVEFSFWVEGVNTQAKPCVYLDIRYADGSFEFDAATLCGDTGTYKWKEYKGAVTVPKKPAYIHYFVMKYGGKGHALVDDVYLGVLATAVKQFAPPPSECVCPRPGEWKTSKYTRARAMGPSADKAQMKNFRVTLVTQLTTDRLNRLRELCKYWKGPTSAAVMLLQTEDRNRAERRLKHIFRDPSMDMTTVHLVEQPTCCEHFVYPINELRNIAIENSDTDYVFLDDVDLVPKENMAKDMTAFLDEMGELDMFKKAAFVVPAFETGLREWVPRNKADLIQKVASGFVNPAKLSHFSPAHAPTDFDRWYESKKMYEAVYKMFFEPYVIVKKGVDPIYDERFQGYGHNKAEHAYELSARGYTFFVLPDAFVCHINHGTPTKTGHTLNNTRVWFNWYDFTGELQLETGYTLFNERMVKKESLAGIDPAKKDGVGKEGGENGKKEVELPPNAVRVRIGDGKSKEEGRAEGKDGKRGEGDKDNNKNTERKREENPPPSLTKAGEDTKNDNTPRVGGDDRHDTTQDLPTNLFGDESPAHTDAKKDSGGGGGDNKQDEHDAQPGEGEKRGEEKTGEGAASGGQSGTTTHSTGGNKHGKGGKSGKGGKGGKKTSSNHHVLPQPPTPKDHVGGTTGVPLPRDDLLHFHISTLAATVLPMLVLLSIFIIYKGRVVKKKSASTQKPPSSSADVESAGLKEL